MERSELENVFSELDSTILSENSIGCPHYLRSFDHQRFARIRASLALKTNELEAIYYMSESHAPTLRLRAALSYEKKHSLYNQEDDVHKPLPKQHVEIECVDMNIQDRTQNLLKIIQELPKEWTVVQLTPQFNPREVYLRDLKKFYTNSLFVSVFRCGEKQSHPFCVNVEAPRDEISGAPVELADEIRAILAKQKETLGGFKSKFFKSNTEKQGYNQNRSLLDTRLKALVKDLQKMYLKEWRCLLVGKYVEEFLEDKIEDALRKFFQIKDVAVDKRKLNILMCMVKNYDHLTPLEIRSIFKSLFTVTDNKTFFKTLGEFANNLFEELSLQGKSKHPLILVVDDSLDCFPWEMMDVLINEPVSRIPSIHFLYALFKEHESSIKGGYKIMENPEKGSYIINPDQDLIKMENRIACFYRYWMPSWSGVFGAKPNENEMVKLLTTSEIYCYTGHGSGAHIFRDEQIQKIRTTAVVILFGCGSSKLDYISPQTESLGTHQMYMIACSPCIVGMLWEVTDLDADVLLTEFLTKWIPNTSVVHWKFLDKTKWTKGEKCNFSEQKHENKENKTGGIFERDLLRALCQAKKCKQVRYYATRAACITRGLPVKIIN